MQCNPESTSTLARILYGQHQRLLKLVPRTYTARAQFDSGAAGDVVPCQLGEKMPADTWIKSVEFVLRQPHLYAGNILKAQHDYYRNRASIFEVECESHGGSVSLCTKFTADGPVPLECFARPAGGNAPDFTGVFGESYLLPKDMNLKMRVSTTEDLAGDSVPATLVLTFKVLQLDGCGLCDIDEEQARAWLASSRHQGG